MNRKTFSAVLCVACAACSDSPTSSEADFSTDEVIASWLVGGGGTTSSSAVFFVTGSGGGDFERITPCPLGGTITHKWSGTSVTENGVKKYSSKGSVRQDACAAEFATPRGALRVTITGALDIQSETHSQPPVNGQRPGILYSRTHQKGHTSATYDGRTQNCEMDVVSEFDADKNTRRMTGTYCGRTIDLAMPAIGR